ncbi:10039_t:CDS:1, partial [Dentiscutata heterogama]
MSNWEKKFENFEPITLWEKYTNRRIRKLKLNEYRLVKINFKLYLEVKIYKSEIIFLTDLKHFYLIQNYTWHFSNQYIESKNKKKNIKFHQLMKPNWNMIDHINRCKFDNRECNLQETTKQQNALNCKLRKNNTSGFNRIFKV